MQRKICLDAGHYGAYNRSDAVPEFYESEFNWKFHLLLKQQLEELGFLVITTRENPQEDMGLYRRGQAAEGCDLFLSIHSNWAQRKTADFPVAIVPLNGTADTLGRKLADCVRACMDTCEPAEVWTKASANGDWYGVIHGAVSVGVPGIILEHGFYSHEKSARWLLNEENLEKMARAEAKVIARHYGLAQPDGLQLPLLKKGSTGACVRALQTLLMGYGFDLGYYGADGDFGGKTHEAVKAYQASNGLSVDGICGVNTWKKLLGLE